MPRTRTRTLLALVLAPSLAPAAAAQGYVCAEGGGGPEGGDWAPSVFGWMLQQKPAADVVVLGTTGGDPDAQAAFLAAGASTAVGLAVNAGNADLPATYAAIAAADIVWMRGGDQWQYIAQWGGTLAEQAIRDVYAGGGVVGGSSAGCAVLGEWIYDAQNGGAFPDEPLEDPFNVYMTFTSGFLQLTPGVLFDTHFTERGRIGRLPIFLARLHEDHGVDLLGIGVDDRTALCVYPDGTAEVRGEGAVTFLHRRADSQQKLAPGEAPFLSPLAHTQLTEGYVYDLATRSVIGRPANALPAPPPGAHPAFADVDLSGGQAGDATLGEWRVEDGGDPSALFLGALTLPAGAGLLSQTVVSTRVWNGTTYDENRVGGAQLALATHPHALALLLDGGVQVSASPTGYLTVSPPAGTETALVVLDARDMLTSAFSSYQSSPQSVGPRQSVALEGATLHVLHEGTSYDALAHEALMGAPYGVGKTNSLGRAAELDWAGSPSREIGNLSVEVTGGVPNQPALLFDGPAAASLPFQGGTLYVAGPFVRRGVRSFDAAGRASWPRAIEAAEVGQTRYHQVWYRDPALGDGFDVALTNGLELRLRP